jgi:predicted Zn-dependent protease with MMP-like domain
MEPRDFDALVEQAIKKIPRRFRRRLQNVVFVVEAEPPRPGLLGLYEGRPLTLRSVSDGFYMPDRITIYQRPHERMSGSLPELRKLVEETVWHEVAHYFGMDEALVRQAERKRRRPARSRRATHDLGNSGSASGF